LIKLKRRFLKFCLCTYVLTPIEHRYSKQNKNIYKLTWPISLAPSMTEKQLMKLTEIREPRDRVKAMMAFPKPGTKVTDVNSQQRAHVGDAPLLKEISCFYLIILVPSKS
tara:strand:+ start:266 stop:595 length:330 start_codon:yes stop_codon:yes gene_type:complete